MAVPLAMPSSAVLPLLFYRLLLLLLLLSLLFGRLLLLLLHLWHLLLFQLLRFESNSLL